MQLRPESLRRRRLDADNLDVHSPLLQQLHGLRERDLRECEQRVRGEFHALLEQDHEDDALGLGILRDDASADGALVEESDLLRGSAQARTRSPANTTNSSQGAARLFVGDESVPLGLRQLQRLCNSRELVEGGLETFGDLLRDDFWRL